MNKKIKKYLEESGRLIKALRLSTDELKKLVEEGPNKINEKEEK